MKLFFVLNRRILAAAFLIIVLLVLLFGQFTSYSAHNKNGDTHKNRMNFIANLGYVVDETAVTQKNIIIPYEFSDVYEEYNLIQQKAGYNLYSYRGKEVVCYSYEFVNSQNDKKRLNLLVFNGEIIGGDISSISIYGEMLPLVKK